MPLSGPLLSLASVSALRSSLPPQSHPRRPSCDHCMQVLRVVRPPVPKAVKSAFRMYCLLVHPDKNLPADVGRATLAFQILEKAKEDAWTQIGGGGADDEEDMEDGAHEEEDMDDGAHEEEDMDDGAYEEEELTVR